MREGPVSQRAGWHENLWTHSELWVVVLLLGLQVFLIWSHPQIPSADGPAYKYSAWVYRQLLDDEISPVAQSFAAREDWLFPNATYSLFLVRASK